MADQAQMNGNKSAAKAVSAATSSLSGLAHDIFALAELQFELLAEDAREALANAKRPFVLMGAAFVVLLAALPVALIGIGWLLSLTGMHVGFAILITAGVAMIAAGIIGSIAWKRLQSATATFRRSADEFRANIAWVKRNLSRERTTTIPSAESTAAGQPR